MSEWLVPMLAIACIGFGIWDHVPVYDAFLRGAERGLRTAFRVLPCIAAIFLMVAVLTASGAWVFLLQGLAPVLRLLGIPEGALPVFLMRPFSGAATLALLDHTLATYGADSMDGRVASSIMGSSETILYTLSIYLGAVGIKRGRYALPAALLAWLTGGIAAAWLCRFF